MKTIVIAGHKGGIGKTTLTILLAQYAHEQGKRVALIDLDPQQSLSNWWEQRPDDDPLEVVDADHTNIDQAKQVLGQEYDLLLIDTPPAHQNIIKVAVAAADIVIAPCGPSPFDIRGVGETIAILEQAKKPFFFVINRAIRGTTIAAETLPLLAAHGKVAPHPLVMRVDYAQGMISGSTPLDTGNVSIKAEVKELYDYLTQQLGKL